MNILKLTLTILMLQSQVFATAGFKTIHVKDLERLLENKTKKVFIYDVNVASTRENVGIIPTSQLIDGGNAYSIEKTLPENKSAKLIFYCANTMCTASHTAAERALANGYKDVSVMVDGIYGWRDAGEKLSPLLLPPKSLKPKEVAERVKKGSAIIVDVREEEERHEIIENEQWSPMSKMKDPTFWSDFVNKLPKDKVIILHCAAGVRSKKVAEKLYAEGVRAAYFKSPDEWKSEGLPVVKGPAR